MVLHRTSKSIFFGDFRNSPFSFQFKESNSSQIKKQYGSYVRYWLLQHDKVVTAYCRSLFVGHCTSEQFPHLKEFGVSLNRNEGLLLHLGIDGPNFNLAFQKKLANSMSENDNEFLDIGNMFVAQCSQCLQESSK